MRIAKRHRTYLTDSDERGAMPAAVRLRRLRAPTMVSSTTMELTMKTAMGLLAFWLAAAGALAAEPEFRDVCAAGYGSTVPVATQLQKLRAPVEMAIATLDNVQVSLSSPMLASGTVSYLTVSPQLAEQLDKICVLGYFELQMPGNETRAVPLVIESVQFLKTSPPSTRVYFRVPHFKDFGVAKDGGNLPGRWDWQHMLHFRYAAFEHTNGLAGRSYFGRTQVVAVSGKDASIIASCLFAVVFYVVAGLAITRPRTALLPGWRGIGRLFPWNITGANGQASLSQLQMLVFTLIVATLLFYQWMRTGLLQEISTDLLYLIGISTAGTAATQMATSIRKDLDPAVYDYVQQLGWFTAPLANPNSKASARGLLMTNGRFDIYKFQMLVFSFVIAAYVIASGATELGNIQISATLLTLMGMSQGAYVGGRAAADVLTPLQDQLRGMQTLQQRCASCTDPEIVAELHRRFRLAAHQAGALFSAMFGRVLPDYMLDLPLDAACQPPPDAAP
jgi:hypothetical protein